MKCACGHSRVMHRKDAAPHRCKATKGNGRCRCEAWRPVAAVVKVRFDDAAKERRGVAVFDAVQARLEIELAKAARKSADDAHAAAMERVRFMACRALEHFEAGERGDAMKIIRLLARVTGDGKMQLQRQEPDQPGAA